MYEATVAVSAQVAESATNCSTDVNGENLFERVRRSNMAETCIFGPVFISRSIVWGNQHHANNVIAGMAQHLLGALYMLHVGFIFGGNHNTSAWHSR